METSKSWSSVLGLYVFGLTLVCLSSLSFLVGYNWLIYPFTKFEMPFALMLAANWFIGHFRSAPDIDLSMMKELLHGAFIREMAFLSIAFLIRVIFIGV